MSGPAAEPTALKMLKGYGPSKVNTDEPQPPEGKPTLPEWAANDEEWGRRFGQVWEFALAQWPWVQAADQEALVAYTTAVVDAERLGRALLRSPLLERDPATGGPKPLTVRKEWQRAVGLALQLTQQFGGSPSSRSHLRSAMLEGEDSLASEAGADALFA